MPQGTEKKGYSLPSQSSCRTLYWDISQEGVSSATGRGEHLYQGGCCVPLLSAYNVLGDPWQKEQCNIHVKCYYSYHTSLLNLMRTLRDSINPNHNTRVSQHFLDAIENITALSALHFYAVRLLSALYMQLHLLISSNIYSGSCFICLASFTVEE